MAEDLKTYQPKWDDHKDHKHRHHHHHHSYDYNSASHTNGWGGWMKMHDKQAYYGLLFIVLGVLAYGGYFVVKLFIEELRAMPMDDPKTEMKVDELNVRRVDKQDALLFGDSLAQTYQIDSSAIKRVDVNKHHVYRPPRKNKEWYITQREWKEIFRNLSRFKQANKNDEKLSKEEKELEKKEQNQDTSDDFRR